MNRQNIWIHITIAVVLITMAAVLGQIRRWETTLGMFRNNTTVKTTPKQVAPVRNNQPEVVVKFRPEVSFAEIKKIAAKHNDIIEDNIESVKNQVWLDDMDGISAEKVAAEYQQMSDLVLYAEPNMQIKLEPSEIYSQVLQRSPNEAVSPNDPLFNEQWALNNSGQSGGKEKADLRALEAWAKTKGSKKVVVAVLDTGVDYSHPDLISNIWMRPDNVPQYKDDELGVINDLHGFNGADNHSDPMDDNGHGTHCAGIIGAEGDNSEGIAGINWNVQIMPLKFLGRSGSGTTKDAIEAINYAIDRKQKGVNVRIISASWGSTAYSKALEDAIRAAGEAGILFVAAAGNDGTNNDNRKHYPSNYDLPNVISVAALDRTDNLASFSNFGVKTVHIAAPGREIVSTWLNDDYREASGTSMATPYVSGTAALILAGDPAMSVEKLRAKLLKSVDKIDALSGKIATGGRINAAKALSE